MYDLEGDYSEQKYLNEGLGMQYQELSEVEDIAEKSIPYYIT